MSYSTNWLFSYTLGHWWCPKFKTSRIFCIFIRRQRDSSQEEKTQKLYLGNKIRYWAEMKSIFHYFRGAFKWKTETYGSAALKSHRKACMILHRFSKAASCWPKAYKIEEVFDILTLSFLSDNAIVFTSCNQGCINREIYVVSGSIYALILINGD